MPESYGFWNVLGTKLFDIDLNENVQPTEGWIHRYTENQSDFIPATQNGT